MPYNKLDEKIIITNKCDGSEHMLHICLHFDFPILQ